MSYPSRIDPLPNSVASPLGFFTDNQDFGIKIFLFAVSSQFKACRDALASDLRLEEYAACPQP